MAVDKRNETIDPKIESLSMYKQILCIPFINNSIPLHLSEPFNVDVEYGRISETTQDFELLDKNYNLIEKIKISNIVNLDLNGGAGGSNISLSSSNGSVSGGGSGNTPPASPQSTPRKESSKANSLLGIDSDSAASAAHITISKSSKASMILGLSSASGDDSSSSSSSASSSPMNTPVKTSSKASSILGLSDDLQQTPTGSASSNKKLGSSTIHSPKFGLLARSASNSKILSSRVGDKEQSGQSSSVNSSPVGSVGSSTSSSGNGSPSMLGSSTGMGGMVGSSPLSQSLGYSSGSGLLGSSPGGSGGSLSGGSPNSPSLPSSIANIFPLHYKYIFTIQTKTINYSFNARDKEESSQLVDALKLVALGKAFHTETQTTLDAITEALELANKCKSPPIPPLPLSPPPPPPHLL